MAKAVLFGGFTNTGLTIVQSTEDNVNFTQLGTVLNGTATYNKPIAFFNNEWFTFGEGTSNSKVVRKTTNFSTYTLLTSGAGYSARTNQKAFVFNNKLWIVGGTIADSLETVQVWNTSDGVTWTKQADLPGITGNFSGFALVVNANGIYIFGGSKTTSTLYNTIFHSTDGVTWTTYTAPWTARFGHSVEYVNGVFILVGGRYSSTATQFRAEVWTSPNGTTDWTQRTWLTTDIFPATGVGDMQSYVLNGRMCLVGNGFRAVSTADGVTWLVDAEVATLPTTIQTVKWAGVAVEADPPPPSELQLSASGTSTSTGSAILELIQLIELSASGLSTSSGSASLIVPIDLSAIGLSTSSGSATLTVDNALLLSASGISTTSGSASLELGAFSKSWQVKKNGVIVPNATVLAVNLSNHDLVYQTTSDVNGNVTVNVGVAGEYAVICFYKDAQGNPFTSYVKPYVTIG